ncbi:MAG: response regulator [Clostridiales bacterium]|nr:response regulator [Clostridiales bacterium]
MSEKPILLIVDDAEANREIMAASFSNEFNILNAENGKEAIDVIQKNGKRISVILLDIIMPQMDGMEVLRWIKDSCYSYIPVIAVTTDPSYQLEALRNGAADFIPKPTEIEGIKARVNNVFTRYSLAKEKQLSKALKESKQEMNNLVNSIPGGIATYKLTDHFETVYFSDGVAQLSGHTREEYAKYIQGDASKIIYKEDKKRVYETSVKALENDESIDITYRIYHKNGGLVWVRLNAVPIARENDGYLVHAVFQRPERMSSLYDNLVNESKNIIYVSDVNNYDLLYINRTGTRLVRNNGKAVAGQKCYKMLFDRNEPCEFCRIKDMSHDQFVERDYTYPITGRTYHLRGKLTDWNGIEAHVEYIEDVDENRKIAQKNEELMNQLSSVIERVPGGMCLYLHDKKGIHPVVHNKAFFDIFGYSDENIQAVEEKTDYLNVHADDLEELKRKLNHAISTSSPVNHTYRTYSDKQNKYIWIKLSAIIIDQNDGTKLCYVSYADVSEEYYNQQQLIESKNAMQALQKQAEDLLHEYQMLVNTVPGGIALYYVADGKIKTKFFSDGLCELSGYTREEREAICKEDAMALIYKEDVALLQNTVKDAVANHTDIDLVYRIMRKDGTPYYVHLTATYIHGKSGHPEFHAVFSDIDKIKRLEKITEEQQLRYEVTVKSAGINIWEYDIQNDSLTVVSNSSRIKQNCYTIENYVSSTVEHDYVRKDSLPAFYSLYDRLKKGEKEITEDIWYKTTDEAGWWCERVIYTSVFDKNGKPIKAFGAGRDVTREKDAIRKFQEEMSYRAVIQGGSLVNLKINLTQNTIIEGNSPFRVVTELIENKNAEHYFTKTADCIISDEKKAEFCNQFNRKALINSFNGGEYSVSLEFTRMFDTKKIYWLKYSVHLMKNPENGDIIALVVTNDITAEKVMKTIMQTVSHTDYDFFVVVDGSINSATDYETSDRKRLFLEEQPFEVRNEELIRQCVCEEDIERVVANCKLDNVFEHIKNGDVYRFNFSMHEKNEKIRRKQLQFTLIDYNRKTFLMTLIDVNEIFMEQQQTQLKLKEALKSAQNAAAAKIEFLSRMSHDIRTPLNAVIGLSELGATSDSMEEMHKYLMQIGASGEYLLSIINDVLDMSKITSNVMVLHPTVVFIPKFIEETIDIVRPTMKAKNISFEVKTNEITSMYMRFDATHVRQIIVNLLSNAVKFTPKNGHIELCLENISRKGVLVKNRMIIRDNGIGINTDFLPRIFQPFEQENTLNDDTRTGTGLGLSIVKSIVDLMGGMIRVESKKGEGAAFIIEWELETATADEWSEKSAEPLSQTTELDNLRILLCEDHPLNAQIASKLLEKRGMVVDHAKNGQLGLEMFQNSEIGYYDAILMDIRMPVMDGITATVKIRTIDRSDAKSVPIIAMTANAFEEDIKKSLAAGMNEHLSKPIDPKKLYDTITEFVGKVGEGCEK